MTPALLAAGAWAAAWAAVPAALPAATPPPPTAEAVRASIDGPPAGFLLDRVVAVVDTQTVTQAELAVEARLALARRAQVPEQAGRVALAAPVLHDVLSYLIGQMLVAREARRVGAEEAGEAEVEGAYAAFAARFADAATLEAWLEAVGTSPAAVRDVLRREQTVERYLGQRLRTRLAGLGGRGADAGASRAAELRAFLPGYLAELRQTVEVRRLTADGALEREARP